MKNEESGILTGFSGTPWRAAFLAVMVVMVVFFGAGRAIWSLGLATGLVGTAVLFATPRFKLPVLVVLCLVLIGLFPLTGLLPLSWGGPPDSWRTGLMDNWGIRFSSTLSPDPRATFEAWLVVATLVVWFWTCLGQGYSRTGCRLALSILALGGSALAGAAFFDQYVKAIPWWSGAGLTLGDTFGPLANRNHSSSLNAISCILCLALAYDAWRRRSQMWIIFALVVLFPLAAIFANTSRGGLLLFFLGLIAWVITASTTRGWWRKAMAGAALLLLVVSVALVSSGRLGSRLRDLVQSKTDSVVGSSTRVDLARETLRISGEHPWMGHGFGTFNAVFPLRSHLQVPDVRFLHPESDLWMLIFEGGLLALSPWVVLLVWGGISSGPWSKGGDTGRAKDRSSRHLRQAAGIGAAMGMIHSIFDVPNHGVGYAMHTLLLFGLAIRPQALGKPAGGWHAGGFRLTGVIIIALGILWAGVDLGKWSPDTSSSVLALRRQVREKFAQGSYRDALTLTDRAIWLAPLDYRLYYLRAQLLLQLRQRPERALLDFGRARALEPHFAYFCFEEGKYWLGVAPDMAIIPWRECLRRLPRESDMLRNYYSSMLGEIWVHPQLHESMWSLAENADMQVTYLLQTPGGELWQKSLNLFLKQHPQIDQLAPAALRQLFRVWHERGDRDALTALLKSTPRLQPFGWRIMASDEARLGHYEEAVLLASKFLKRQEKPSWSENSNLDRLERAFVLNPSDPRPGVELYYAQRAIGDLKAARVTAEKVVALPSSPAYMKLELATLYMEFKEHRLAWEMMEQAMQVAPET